MASESFSYIFSYKCNLRDFIPEAAIFCEKFKGTVNLF